MERKNETVTRERIEKLSTEDICEIQRNGILANADEKDQVEAKKMQCSTKGEISETMSLYRRGSSQAQVEV